MKHFAFCLLPLWALTGCALGPDYHRPETSLPATFREAGFWQPAQAGHPENIAGRDDWWRVYDDPRLDALIPQVAVANQNIAQAAAQVRETQALLAASQAGFWPTLGIGVSGTRSQAGNAVAPGNQVKIALNASWEPDVWGKVAHQLDSGQAALQASQADLQSALLSAQLTLAQTVFQLGAVEAQQDLLEKTIHALARALDMTQSRHAAGVSSRLDVVQAETQLETARAQQSALGTQRARLVHAIALLVGKLPSELTLPAAGPLPAVPALPEMLPATLLERRPDIAAAERRMAAANAQIGVTRSAWFPNLGFSVSGGYQNSSLSSLLTQPHRFWSLGPTLALTLFDAGGRSAQESGAMAAYDKTVAGYRQIVLAAFQEVEDNLATFRGLNEEIASQTRAVQSAEEALRIAESQYRAGVLAYLNVVSAQTTALAAKRSLLGLQAQILSSHAVLLKTFAGGWAAGSEV